MTFDSKNSVFTRSGSFRHTTLTDRLKDPQEIKPGAGTAFFSPHKNRTTYNFG